ncbi:hypothetical protein G443_001560 [Actinoalloteichus cyanogriseus DSM 43889]|uniref:Hedgehog/Intein (Hint) domain-containing protein n=1 Tax=Actinoalloteichus caeruleus DSM 43889 TaxID=1120930 RepID=A0ABT1JFM4_ACTCY|nr:Hint domain-containing protein [Actinoalloteichus caeruleus]MCP2331290.1 hypothetical protein [Actinoalloteichus caeruleus DSM 43889]
MDRVIFRVRTWRREREEATALLRNAGCRVNSFVPGTLVLLADGTRTPIEDIQLGDEVLASDPDTGEIGPQRVVATITNEGPKTLVDVSHTPSPDQLPGTVTATDEHPFWSTTTATGPTPPTSPEETPSSPPPATTPPSPTPTPTPTTTASTTSPSTPPTRTMYWRDRHLSWFTTAEDAFPFSGTGAASGSSSEISLSC